jgi:hypothetical protein
MQHGRNGFIMARSNAAEVEVVENDEVETVDATEAPKEPKAKAAPKRGELPEGYVTPVQLAKVITEKGLHTDREGGHEVKPQMVYSYIKNSPKEDPFPISTVTDSIGVERQALLEDEGVAWWERKNERVAARKANAEQKATAKAERAAAKAVAEAEGDESTAEVTEAE